VLHARALQGNPFDGHTLSAGHHTELDRPTGVETRRIRVDKRRDGADGVEKARSSPATN
jgi:hypothetical protein